MLFALVLYCFVAGGLAAKNLPRPLLPRNCFAGVFTHHEGGCTDLEEIQRQTWALELTKCHYETHQRLRISEGCHFPRNCSRLEDTEAFTVFTVFFTHVQEICLFYERLVIHDNLMQIVQDVQKVIWTKDDHLHKIREDVDQLREDAVVLQRKIDIIYNYVASQTRLSKIGVVDVLWFSTMFFTAWRVWQSSIMFYVSLELFFEMFFPAIRWYMRAFQGLASTYHLGSLYVARITSKA